MTLRQIISDVRARVRELVPKELSDALIREWVNQGQDDFARRTLCLTSRASTSTMAGGAEYGLPADVLKIQVVTHDSAILKPIPISELEDYEGAPDSYAEWGDAILLSPVPSESGTLVVYYYQTPDDLVNDDDVSLLPVRFHEALVFYAAWHALEHSGTEMAIAQADRMRASYMAMAGEEAVKVKRRKPNRFRVERSAGVEW